MKRYYNLKHEKLDVMGHIIEINTDFNLEDRVKLLTPNDGEQFRLLKYQDNKALYELGYLADSSLTDSTNPGKTIPVTISVLKDGKAELYNYPKKEKFYFNEISKEDADRLIENYEKWIMQELYLR